RRKKKKKKKKHSVESNKDVALKETINATAAYAQEQLCKVAEALAVLDSAFVLCSKMFLLLGHGQKGVVGGLGRGRGGAGDGGRVGDGWVGGGGGGRGKRAA
nr:hypothetical protein [Tanacetum cinerariifolium]